MKLLVASLSLWPWHRAAPPARGRPAFFDEVIVITEADVLVDEVSPPGCGWFDSSHELQHGLSVTEHASAQCLAAELPLDDWIDLHLAGWQPVPGSAP